jgi:hypothetical protein
VGQNKLGRWLWDMVNTMVQRQQKSETLLLSTAPQLQPCCSAAWLHGMVCESFACKRDWSVGCGVKRRGSRHSGSVSSGHPFEPDNQPAFLASRLPSVALAAVRDPLSVGIDGSRLETVRVEGAGQTVCLTRTQQNDSRTRASRAKPEQYGISLAGVPEGYKQGEKRSRKGHEEREPASEKEEKKRGPRQQQERRKR